MNTSKSTTNSDSDKDDENENDKLIIDEPKESKAENVSEKTVPKGKNLNMKKNLWEIMFCLIRFSISISFLISDVEPGTGAKEDIIDVKEVSKTNANSDSDIAENDEEDNNSVSYIDTSSIDSTKPVKAVQNFHPQLTAIEKLLLKGKYRSKFGL